MSLTIKLSINTKKFLKDLQDRSDALSAIPHNLMKGLSSMKMTAPQASRNLKGFEKALQDTVHRMNTPKSIEEQLDAIEKRL